MNTRARAARFVTLSVSCLVLLAACGGESGAPESTGPASVATGPTGPSPTAASEVTAEDFDPSRFDAGAPIDNAWLPLTPGAQLTFRGSSLDEGERLSHRVVFTISDMVKDVAGVRVVVIWARDFTDGELVEAELAFFAQDTTGIVWHLGEYPEEYEDGEIDKTPAWIEGQEGATAGIQMLASPTVEAPDYAQGFAPPPINWEDRGQVDEVGTQTCVPAGCYEDVVVVEEFELSKPDASQLKFYAPGIGNVRVGWRGDNDEDQEVLKLVEHTMLSPDQMEEVRANVLALDARAYERFEAYGATSPAQVA